MSDGTGTRHTITRRGTLLAAGSLLGGASLGASGSRAATVPPSDATAAVTPTVTYELGAEIGGWVGQSPGDVGGETNPTLSLVPGNTYEVIYENLDGITHDFQILDAGGSVLVDGGDVSDSGDTNSVEFVASADMTDYRCRYHPSSMTGSIATDSTPTSSPTPSPTPTPTETPTPSPTNTPTTTSSPTRTRSPTATESPAATGTSTATASPTGPSTGTETTEVVASPGFGVGIAVVAILTTVGLNLRKRDTDSRDTKR